MNPLELFVLYTYMTVAGQTGCRTYLGSDKAALQAYGEKLQAEKPAEASAFGFMVLPAEGIS